MQSVFQFPTQHPALAWWLVLPFALAPMWSALKNLPIWSRRFQRGQVERKIQALEGFHQNPLGLLVYVATDLIDIGFELSIACIAIAVLTEHTKLTGRYIVFLAMLNLGSTVLGRTVRLRGILRGLSNESATLTALRDKLARLS